MKQLKKEQMFMLNGGGTLTGICLFMVSITNTYHFFNKSIFKIILMHGVD